MGRNGGALRTVAAATLAATVVGEVVSRTGVPAESVDDVILGQCFPAGDAPAIGRVAALDAGLPTTVPGMQVGRRDGAGLQAVIDAVARVTLDPSSTVIAGGAESMSNVEHYALLRWGGWGNTTLADRVDAASRTAGGAAPPLPGWADRHGRDAAAGAGITREQQDRLALESHRRAVAAATYGRFAEEIVGVLVPGRRGEVLVDRDEPPRPNATLEALAGLRSVLLDHDPDSSVTAGNACGHNDAAAACLIVSHERAWQLGLSPMARLISWSAVGVAPGRLGLGPVPAAQRGLDAAGLTLADLDLIELQETFAAQVLAVTRIWGLGQGDLERLNVNGSGIALGHPGGATGARILTTMLRELERRDGRYALATVSCGGGQGLAAVFERVSPRGG